MSTVKLITEQGTFEADSVAELPKMLRKAARDEKKRNNEIAANGTLANMRAAANGFHVLQRFLSEGKPPRGWRYYEAGHKYGPRLTPENESDEGSHGIFYETEHGRLWGTHYYGFTVLGHVWNGAGHTLCVFMHDAMKSETIYCVSPGIAGDQLRTVELPGITIEWFQKIESELAKDEAA